MTPPQYVSFDDDGNIISIGPSITPNYNYFETEYKSIEKLLTLQEDPINYIVRYSSNEKKYKLVSMIIEKDKDYKFIEVKLLQSSDFDLLLQINNKDSSAKLIADRVLSSKLNTKKFMFYFTKKNNPNIFYKSIEFTLDQEVTDDLFIDTNYSIYTVRNLEKICYEVK